MKSTNIKNSIVGLKDLRENMEEYIKAVDAGKSFTVVRRSRPIFRLTPVDEWGDDGVWEKVIDFTEIHPEGVPIGEVVKGLKKIDG